MSDEEEDRSKELIDWDEDYLAEIAGKKPNAKYGALSEKMRHALPEAKICAMFCGGKKCKYCNPSSYSWKPERMVIKGLFSQWVTENILAMSRPSTDIIEKFELMKQFKEQGITSIINLQQPGEHASCGGGCVNGEFSYLPQDFMDNDVFFYNFGWPDLSVPENFSKVLDMCKVLQYAISQGKVAIHCHAGKVFFYNFGWPDYGVGSLPNMLDMVKVMQFALSEGKVAIHCHAGLGRTGVLIGCYLVYANRMNPDDAVHFIRKKREGAIQTRNQVGCIQEFSQFLAPLRIIFSNVQEGTYDFNLSQFLTRQKRLLHGHEARNLKFVPKIVYECCRGLQRIAGCRQFTATSHDNMESVRASAPGAFNNTRRSLPRSLTSSPTSSSAAAAADPDHSGSNSLKTVQSDPDFHGSSLRPSLRNRSYNSFTSVEFKGRMSEGNRSPQSSPFGSETDLLRHLSTASLAQDERAQIVGYAMAQTEYSEKVTKRIANFKLDLNEDASGAWRNLGREQDPHVLAGLLWDWLDHLKDPVLHPQDMPHMLEQDPEQGLAMLGKGSRGTIDHLLCTVASLGTLPDKLTTDILQRLLSTLTHQNMLLELEQLTSDPRASLVRRTSNPTGIMRGSVATRLMFFFSRLLRHKVNLMEQGMPVTAAARTRRRTSMLKEVARERELEEEAMGELTEEEDENEEDDLEAVSASS